VVFVSRNFVSRNEDVLYHFPLVMVHNRRSR
jgi:hypothetical protein